MVVNGVPVLLLVACRDIQAGERLLLDYHWAAHALDVNLNKVCITCCIALCIIVSCSKDH